MRQEQYDNIRDNHIAKLGEWRENYRILNSELLKLECQPITKANINIIQNRVDEFIKDNEININLNVKFIVGDNRLVVFGSSLQDNLIWESIQ